MRTLLIDRMEGIYAICEDADQRYFAIKQTELPQEAKEGDVIEISGEGEISINIEKTEARRAKIRKMQKDLWDS